NLSNLALSSGTLSPSFTANTTSYTASVANAVSAITVTPVTSSGFATVTVNGTTVASGSASGSIALAVGQNTITTVVTAQDGTTIKTYTVV
ncbi:cadherin-like beta sandwich domain-containing protein, partial [Acinetobacter baumannii]